MQNRREVPRYMCELPARLFLPDGHVIGDLTVTRLGVRGCGVTGPGVPGIGQRGELVIEWQGSQFQAEAEVVWQRKDSRSGFRFTTVDATSRELLITICGQHPLQPLLKPPAPPAQ